jgi:hypothetical protein
MTYHPYEYLARAKVAEVERNAADPGRLMAHELRRTRASRRRPRRPR